MAERERTPVETALNRATLKQQPMNNSYGGLQLVLPASVSEAVRAEFGRHCQHLDDSLRNLENTVDQLALANFMIAHLSALATVIQLAMGQTTD